MLRFLNLFFCLMGLVGLDVLVVGVARGQEVQINKRVAVMPITTMGASPEVCQRLRQQIVSELQRESSVELTPTTKIDQSVNRLCGEPAQRWECLAQDNNLLRIGEELTVHAVLAGQLAAMGKTHVLKILVVNIESGTVFSEVVNITATTDGSLLGKFTLLQEWLRPKQSSLPWYQRWEVWTAVGAGAALVTGLLIWGLTSSADPNVQWDYHRILP